MCDFVATTCHSVDDHCHYDRENNHPCLQKRYSNSGSGNYCRVTGEAARQASAASDEGGLVFGEAASSLNFLPFLLSAANDAATLHKCAVREPSVVYVYIYMCVCVCVCFFYHP